MVKKGKASGKKAKQEKKEKTKTTLIPFPKKMLKDMGIKVNDGGVFIERKKLSDFKAFTRPKEETAEVPPPEPKEEKKVVKRVAVESTPDSKARDATEAKRLQDIGVY